MYTNIPSVLILVSLMKQFNIRYVVASPGTRNTPLVHSIENDDFFKVYSVVDERSAGFVALGMSEELDEPVCVTCTAATATCNYAPAMKEAYERKIQLVALTADQNIQSMFHMEDQCIDQRNMYEGYVKYAVDVPKIRDESDYWYCNRCINEAFLELNHNGKGPVQINYHVDYGLEELAVAPVRELPQTRKITRYYEESINWKNMSDALSGKKILVLGGSNLETTGKLKQQLNVFFDKYDAVLVCDHFANERGENILNPAGIGDVWWSEVDKYRPDYIITFGNIFYSTIKYAIGSGEKTKHWHIAIDGTVNDGFRCLENLFEMTPETFFENINKHTSFSNNHEFYNVWKEGIKALKYPELNFTNFNAIMKLSKKIPPNSIVHMSVLDSIRLTNYCELDSNIECFANIGADGIDGALSAFLGQARDTTELSFLIIGDLSMIYDMNSLLNKMSSNVRIFVINNYAGAEFHKNFGLEAIPTLNDFIAAGHNTRMKQISELNDFEYMVATDNQELDQCIFKFVENDGKAKILEIITDADTDAKTLKEYWKINTRKMPVTFKSKCKNAIKKVLGKRGINVIKALKG